MLFRKLTSECKKESKGGLRTESTFSLRHISEFKVGEIFPRHLYLAVSHYREFAYHPYFLSSFRPFSVHASISSLPPSSFHFVIRQKIMVICVFMSTCWQEQWLAWRYTQVSASVCASVWVDASYFVCSPSWNPQLESVELNSLDKWRLNTYSVPKTKSKQVFLYISLPYCFHKTLNLILMI